MRVHRNLVCPGQPFHVRRQHRPEHVPRLLVVRHQRPAHAVVLEQPVQVQRQAYRRDRHLPTLEHHKLMHPFLDPGLDLVNEIALRPKPLLRGQVYQTIVLRVHLEGATKVLEVASVECHAAMITAETGICVFSLGKDQRGHPLNQPSGPSPGPLVSAYFVAGP